MLNKLLNLYRRNFWSPERYATFKGVKIGENCSILSKDFFSSEPYLIEIGEHVQITKGVRFFTHGGSWVFREKYPEFDYFGKIKIGNNVYIGNNAMIMPGVTVDNNVIIGAGTIVTKSVPAGVIVVGSPARIVGNVVDLEKRILKFNLNIKKMDPKRKKEMLLSADDSMFIIK